MTVCVLNLLVVLSVIRLRDPVLPLIIWVLVPVGFAVTGPMASPATGSWEYYAINFLGFVQLSAIFILRQF